MSDFEIEEGTEGEVAILSPIGSLNTRTSPTFEQRLGALLEAKARLVVVDMKGVDYLSSPALRVLLMTTRRLKRVGGKLLVCGLREEVRKVFAITGFDRDFNIQPTRADAVALAAATELPPLEETKVRKAEKKPAPAAAAPPPPPVAAAPEPAPPPLPPSRPPAPAPHPVAVLALKLLSKDEEAAAWSRWPTATLSGAWRDQLLATLAR